MDPDQNQFRPPAQPDFASILQGLQIGVEPQNRGMPKFYGGVGLDAYVPGLSLQGHVGPPPAPGMPVDWKALMQFNKRF